MTYHASDFEPLGSPTVIVSYLVTNHLDDPPPSVRGASRIVGGIDIMTQKEGWAYQLHRPTAFE